MATTGTRPKQSAPAGPPIPTHPTQTRVGGFEKASSGTETFKPTGYGLPCANCHLYYPADLDTCPTCDHSERVSPFVPTLATKRTETVSSPVHDSAAVEQQREEFLRQFKSQLLEVHADVANVHGSLCALKERHDGSEASAQICKECYQLLQERIDICEAALQMDLKEAAQIIYDAVWADPSDPSKTYENAASAILAELRKRAAIEPPPHPFHPLPD